ncbi:MAG: MurR/RpiR family transcriptional regulator [Clostridia bacterium]
MSDILAEIKNRREEFSKGQKLIADFVLEHYDKAAYMTAHKLGVAANVSESTVVRFATELGYDGYPKFQKDLLNLIRTKLTAVQRMQVANERVSSESVLDTVLNSDIEQIRTTLGEIDHEVFDEVVDELIKANKIYILGVRSSSALASFMGFYFNLMFDNVKLINSASSSEIFEQTVRVREGDVVLGISFPRYSQRTVKMIEYARTKGAKTIALTDSKTSPLAENSDYTLVSKSDMASFADSLVAPLSIINALISAISQRKSEDIVQTLTQLENIWDEYEVYNINKIGE